MTFYDYDGFVEKFKPKKTTDDCYTTPAVYEAVRKWAFNEYGIEADTPIIRPFYPGGDYENAEYPHGCVVIDNPPFSILSQIVKFYNAREISYFLFAPALTLFNYGRTCNYIIVGKSIKYENGAEVATGFLTNLGETRIHLSASLNDAIIKAQKAERGKGQAKYDYPPNVINAALLQKYVKGGIEMRISGTECHHIRALDAQRVKGKEIFGTGFLISSCAAARLEAARLEAAKAVTVWGLSDREQKIVRCLDDGTPIPIQETEKTKILPAVEGGEQMRMEI